MSAEKMEVNNRFYLLIKKERGSVSMIIHKELNNVVRDVIECVKAGLSSNDMKVVEIRIENGELKAYEIGWGRILEIALRIM